MQYPTTLGLSSGTNLSILADAEKTSTEPGKFSMEIASPQGDVAGKGSVIITDRRSQSGVLTHVTKVNIPVYDASAATPYPRHRLIEIHIKRDALDNLAEVRKNVEDVIETLLNDSTFLTEAVDG